MDIDQDMIDGLLAEESEPKTEAPKKEAVEKPRVESRPAPKLATEKKVEAKLSSVTAEEMDVINNANQAEEKGEGGSFRGDINARTIGRLMGLATTSELKVLEGKVDLMISKIANITVRMDKALQLLADASTGSDLERIDVQIAAMRTYMAQALGDVAAEKAANSDATKTGQNIKTAD